MLYAVDGSVLYTVDGSVLYTVDGSVLYTVDGSVLYTVDGSVLYTVDGSVLCIALSSHGCSLFYLKAGVVCGDRCRCVDCKNNTLMSNSPRGKQNQALNKTQAVKYPLKP